jgi:outer membrane protein assembly factor BamA
VIRLSPVLCLALIAASITPASGQDCAPAQTANTMPAPIRLITFSNAALLPQEKQDQLAKIYRDQQVTPGSVDRDLDSFAEELGERVRAEYQNMGYFKVEVDSHAIKTADEHVYDLETQVRSVGAQYRLGEIRFLHTTVFPATQLRELFPIARGEVFSRVKIAEGLEQIRKLYGTQGYINFTPVPVTEFDDEKGIGNLTIDIDEGKQFHFGQIEVSGVDDVTRTRVLTELGVKVGDVYTPEAVRNVLSKFPELVQYPSPTTSKRLNEQTGTIDLVLGFRKPSPCPTAQ